MEGVGCTTSDAPLRQRQTGYWLCYFFFFLRTWRRRKRRKEEEGSKAEDLEDVDLVSLDGVEVVVHGQEDLGEKQRERWCQADCVHEIKNTNNNKRNRTRKDPNMAMEERKCQMSWSSKNESRMQSLLCSRDSAGVFYVNKRKKFVIPASHYTFRQHYKMADSVCVNVWESLTCQVLRPWKKKYSANPHTTAVKRIHTNAKHWILSPLRSWTEKQISFR